MVIVQSELPVTPSTWQRRVEGYPSATKEQHTDEGTGAMKTEGTSGDHSELVVETFGESVCELGIDISENSIFVFSDGSGCLYEGCEFGTGSPGEPPIQFFFGRVAGCFVEDISERFFEQVGSIEPSVVSLDCRELVPLLGAEVPWAPEQCESGFLDRGGLFRVVEVFEAADHLSSHFIDGVSGEFDYMEEVEDDLGVGHLGLDRFDEGFGHVDGDNFDRLCPRFPKLFEEGVECIRVFSFGGPDNAFAVVVNDRSDVAMSFSIAEFIDADAP